MSRLASLLLLGTLVVGLLITFNPDAKARAETIWEEVKPALIEWKERITANTDVPNGDESRTPQPTPTVEEDSEDRPIVTINWDAFWESLKKVWLDLKSRIRLNES